MTLRRRRRDRVRAAQRVAVNRAMRARLFDDEEVVFVAHPGRLATVPRFVLTLGLYSFWRRHDTWVLTDQRVLLGKGIMRRSERSIPLSRVDDVTFARSGLNSYADLTFHDRRGGATKRIGPMTPQTAHRFTREIQRRL
ncbi:MAG TPA: PH domain-containing protein [Jiangellaceae bacterium]